MLIKILAIYLLLFTSVSASAHEGHAAGGDKDARLKQMWAKMLEKKNQIGISVASDAKGRLWLVRVEDGHVRVARSDDGGQQFGASVTVNAESESIISEGESRPKIQVFGDLVYVSWTQNLAKPFSGNVRFSLSRDAGLTFAAPRTINDDGLIIPHAFDTLQVDPDGKITLIWLDKRESTTRIAKGEKYVGTSVFYAVSSDEGRSFGANRKLADNACECCRLALALDQQGVPVAMWRHVFGKNTRDFAFARLDGKNTISRVAEDDWSLDACPHRGGALAVDEQNEVHAVWFTLGRNRQGLFYRRLSANGLARSEPMGFGERGAQAGHPTILVQKNTVYLAWLEFDGKENRIMLMRSANNGKDWSQPANMAATAGAADYPHLVVVAGQPKLVWNTLENGLQIADVTQK